MMSAWQQRFLEDLQSERWRITRQMALYEAELAVIDQMITRNESLVVDTAYETPENP